ncbi:MAG: two-component sensor histidine kinase, partial [Lachnospiraceae bacterium]|nr:two-component sensor histidine kinase [Lachnospiraceae bacterium]
MVIISGVRKYLKWNILKSLRVRIILLVILAGLIPVLILRGVILSSYEKSTVEVRTAEIQNQCTILCNQLSDANYLTGETSDVMRSELVQMSNIYNGRVLVIDQDFRIQEDTYDMDVGKTIVSEDVIRCFAGKGTSNYDARNKYIEVTSPIYNRGTEGITGVMLISVSTDMIIDSVDVISDKLMVMCLTIGMVIIILAIFAGFVMVRPFQRIT